MTLINQETYTVRTEIVEKFYVRYVNKHGHQFSPWDDIAWDAYEDAVNAGKRTLIDARAEAFAIEKRYVRVTTKEAVK